MPRRFLCSRGAKMMGTGVSGGPGRSASLMAVVVALALIATSCASLQSRDVRTVELNALWYGVIPETGENIGGVSPVLIRFSPESQELDIDVEAQQASGAGAQWVAASWLGSTTSLLDHTIDPASVQLVFEVSDTIDGPSAGALMAVGVAAALRGDPVGSKIAMTGTIEADGSIGDVGGIPYKVRGAAAAGIETVLIPSGQRSVQDPGTGGLIDVVALGAALGVDVREVDDIAQAYEIMTGRPLDAEDRPPVADPVSEDFEQRLLALTHARLERVNSAMRVLESSQAQSGVFGSDWYRRAADASEHAESAIAAGETAVAYESAMTASLLSRQALSDRVIGDSLRLQSFVFVRDELRMKARDLDELARDTVQGLASNSDLADPGRAIAFGDALAWATTGGLVAYMTADGLAASPPSRELLTEAGAAIARSEVYLEASRDALALSHELRGEITAARTSHLALSDLMWEAGSASLAYLDDVVVARMAGQMLVAGPSMNNFLESPDADYAYVKGSEAYLEELVVGLDPRASATVRSAVALERYIYSSFLIAKYSTLQSSLDSNGYVVSVGNRAQLDEYAALANEHLDESISEAAATGFDTSYLHFLGEWGRSRHQRGKARASALDEAYGLAFLWRAFVLGQIHRIVGG